MTGRVHERVVWRGLSLARALSVSAVLTAANLQSGCDGGVTPPTPALLSKVAGDSQVADVGASLPAPLVVKVSTAGGQAVEGVSVTWIVTEGGAQLSATSTTTDVIGHASVVVALGNTPGPQSVNASVGGLGGSPVRFRATGVPGPPAELSAMSGSEQSAAAGTSLPNPIVARVVDRFGNPVSEVGVSFAIVGGGGSVSSATANTDGSGLAQTTWTLGTTAGYNTLSASVDGLAPVLYEATGVPGNAASMTVAAGDEQNGVAGSVLPTAPAVMLEDVNGNAVPGVGVTFTVSAGGGTIMGGASTTDAAGIAAAASWRLGTTAGANTVTATATGLTPVVFTATGVPGPPTRMTAVAGDGQSAVAGTALPVAPAVRVADANDNAVAGVSVAFAIASGGGSITGDTPTTDSSGEAVLGTWRLGTTVGENSLTATVDGVTPLLFTATGVPGPPANVTIAAGDGQTAVAGTAVAVAPAVRVTDSNDNPVPDIVVTFSVTSGGGSVSRGSALTDAGGVSSTGGWTLGIAVGANTLSASVSDLPPLGFSGSAVGFIVEHVAAGSRTSCARTAGGAAYCWGQNAVGHVGDGTTVDRLTPAPVAGSLVFASLAAGGSNACGLTAGQAAYCWGDNFFGNVGDGTTATVRTAPVPVVGGLLFTLLEGGGGPHTCGLVSDGRTYCWGNNEFGNLGDSTTTVRPEPAAAVGGLTFSALAAGIHTCGLTQTGAAYCWGRNFPDGKLGDSSTTDRWSPTPVWGSLAFTVLVAGLTHTCGIASGATYCWGRNDQGQIGDGTTSNRLVPTEVPGGLAFVSLTAGRSHTCGLTTNGTAYCWGANSNGELGDGTSTAHPVPQPVATTIKFRLLDSSYDHTCGVATSGAVYCWGDNTWGGLGDGSRVSRSSPVAVRPPGF